MEMQIPAAHGLTRRTEPCMEKRHYYVPSQTSRLDSKVEIRCGINVCLRWSDHRRSALRTTASNLAQVCVTTCVSSAKTKLFLSAGEAAAQPSVPSLSKLKGRIQNNSSCDYSLACSRRIKATQDRSILAVSKWMCPGPHWRAADSTDPAWAEVCYYSVFTSNIASVIYCTLF